MTDEETGNAPVETPAATDDLRSMIEAAYDAQEAASVETAEDKPKDDRARDDLGRFAPKAADEAPKAEKPKEAAPVAEQVPPDVDKPAEQPTPASTSVSGPPVSWSADAKQVWASLPPAIQAAVAKREEEASAGIRQWSERAKQYEGLAKTVEPHLPVFQRYNVQPAEGIQRLLAAQDYLTRDPENALIWLAQSRGVDLSKLAEAVSNGYRPQQPSAMQSQQPQIDIRSEVRTEIQQARMEAAIADFAAKHEHYPAVESLILSLAPVIKAENPSLTPEQILQEAYDRAVYANPQTRSVVLQAQQAASVEKQRADQKAALDKARSASASLSGKPPAGNRGKPSGSVGSVRDDIIAAFEAHS